MKCFMSKLHNMIFCIHKAGQTVQMSSLLLGDPTKSYFKLSLWREAAVWVERIAAGDIVYFTSELLLGYIQVLTLVY